MQPHFKLCTEGYEGENYTAVEASKGEFGVDVREQLPQFYRCIILASMAAVVCAVVVV